MSNPNFRDERRAYDLRLAKWLDLNPSALVEIADEDVMEAPLGGPERLVGYDVTWMAVDDLGQTVAEADGRYPMPRQVSGTHGEPTRVRDGVHLRGDEADRMRAEVGPRPELFTPEERAALEALR